MNRDLFENYDIPEEYSKFGRFGKLVWCVEHNKKSISKRLVTPWSVFSNSKSCKKCDRKLTYEPIEDSVESKTAEE